MMSKEAMSRFATTTGRIRPGIGLTGLGAALVTLAALFGLATTFAPQAGAYVYWGNNYTDTIGRANLDGTDIDQSFIAGAASPTAVAVDLTHVYWGSGTNAIGRANLNGSSPNGSFITGSQVSDPEGMAVDGSYVYWANYLSSAPGDPFQGTIGRANIDGSSPQFLIESNYYAFMSGVDVDASHVYWTEGSAVGRADLDGSNVNHSFITGASSPCRVAVDGSHVYWSNSGTATIGRADLNGSNVNQSFISGLANPCGVAVDGSHIYWANPGAGTIGRANLNGTSPDDSFIVAADSYGAIDLAVDAGGPTGGAYTLNVYKSGSGGGTVTSNPAGINCGSTCSHDYDSGTPVILTATPAVGSTFAGWSGSGCSGTGTCYVSMTADRTVTATFNDTQAPDATAPVQSLVRGAQLGTSTVPVRFAWTASDNVTPAGSIQSTLQQRTSPDGSSWSGYSSLVGPITAKVATSSFASGNTYRQFRVRAEDQAGNVGLSGAGPAFRVKAYQEGSSSINYAGTWHLISQTGAFGGSVKRATQAGAKATLTSTGRNLAVVMPLASTGGTAQICLDPGTASESCSTVDLSPSSGLGPRKEVFVRNGLSASTTHKVQVTVVSGPVDLDAFVALR
jgi:virginiamycin B lyase